MTQPGRRGLRRKILLGALLIFVGAVAFLRTETAATSACTLLRRQLPSLLGLEVGIGRCELDPITQTVRLRGVSLFEPGVGTPLIAADEAEVSLGAIQPFLGTVELDAIRIIRPRVSLDLTGAGSTEDRASGDCSLSALERLEISRLEIRDAEVRLLLGPGQTVEVLGADVSWRRRRGRAEIRVQADQGVVTTGATSPRGEGPARLELATLVADARFDPEDLRLEITRTEIALDGISVSGSGDVDDLCDPQLALEASVFVPMHALAEAVGLGQRVGGHLWARVSVEGTAKAPAISFDVAGSDVAIGVYTPGSFDVRGALEADTVRIEELRTSAGEGTVLARGRVGLTPRIPVEFEVETYQAELGPILARSGLPGAWVNFPATGRGRIGGQILPSLDLRGEAAFRTGRFVLASRAYDAPEEEGRTILEFEHGEVGGRVHVLPDRVELLDVVAKGPRSSATANTTLWYDPGQGLDIQGTAGHVDFQDFGHLVEIPWHGTGGGTFRVHGPYSDVRASAVVSLRDFDFWKFSLGVVQGRLEYADDVLSFPAASGQKGRTQYHGHGSLRFTGGPMLTKGYVEVPRGRLEDLVDVLLPMHENMDHFQGSLDGDFTGTVSVDSPSDAFAGIVELEVKDARYFGRGLGDGRVRLRFEDGDRMVLEKTVFRGALGRTEVDGTWDFDGPLDYRFRVDGSLAGVIGPGRAKELELDGALTLVGKVGGDTTVYTVNAWLTSPAIRFAGRNLGSTHLEGRLIGRDLQVWGKPFDGARTNLEMRVKDPWPWKVTASVSLPEIRPLLPEVARSQGFSGSVAASVDAVGNLRDLRSIEGAAVIDRLTLTRGDFHGTNDGRIELSWRGGKLTVENFALRGPNTQLVMQGTAGPKLLDMNLHGTFDVRLIESFVPYLERSSGRVEVTAAAAGTFEVPTLAGTASLEDARFTLRDQPFTFRGLSGRVEFSEKRILIHQIAGVLNEGAVRLDGDVRLDRFKPRFMQLRLAVDEVSARPVEYLPFTTTGELHLAGRPDALTLSGDLDIVRLRYDQPLVLESFLTDLQTARVGQVGGGQPKKEWLAFDVAVHANGDVRVDNNLAKARLKGDLRLTGTNVQPGIVGSIEAQPGSQIYFRGNTFQVSQALVEFKDRREIDPVFDMHAQTQVREYLVSLHGFGRIRDPQIILTSDPDLPEADILSLLTIGVTSRDQSDAAGTAQYIVGEAFLSASGLDRQVQKFLPKNPLLRDLSFHISSTYNEASGYVEPTAQLESKFLTDRLQLQLTQPVVSNRGTRAHAEYRFDDRLAGQLQWDNDRNEDLPNFGVDLKLRWEVE